MALPMPRAAPVIKAVLPSKSPILFSNFKVEESHWLIIFLYLNLHKINVQNIYILEYP
jgi:hypothetical protein